MPNRMNYLSTSEKKKHISKVQNRIDEILDNLDVRRMAHDASKLLPPEKEAFDSLGPPEEMAKLTYGSDEYKARLRQIKPAIDHHYAKNDHHPEHYVMWQCPLCHKRWSEDDLKNDMRDPHFCPSCVPNGTMYEAQLELDSGISGMSLTGLLEMLADWKAAGERHATGNLKDSLVKNKERFKIESQLQSILENTAKELGWI